MQRRLPKISVLGSCRVHRPLIQVCEMDLVELRTSGVRGFCHSTPEILQKFRYADHQIELPEHLQPYILGAEQDAGFPREAAGYFSETEAYVVEVSSLKHLSIDGCAIQIELFRNNVVKAYKLGKWWTEISSLAKGKNNVSLKCTNKKVPEEIRDIASSLVISTDTGDEIACQIGEIKEMLGKPMIVFGHLALSKIDGTPLVSDRVTLNGILREACERLQIPFVAPEYLLQMYGSKKVLVEGSTDHWHKRMLSTIGKHYLNDSIYPLLGCPPLTEEEWLKNHVRVKTGEGADSLEGDGEAPAPTGSSLIDAPHSEA